MNTGMSKLLAAGWNERHLTRQDADQLIEREKIDLRIEPMLFEGLYLVRRNRPRIFLNAHLTGYMSLLVLWHEIAHHILHSPNMCFYHQCSLQKYESEAQRVAVCSLIPYTWVLNRSLSDIQDELQCSKELCWDRKFIYETYNY